MSQPGNEVPARTELYDRIWQSFLDEVRQDKEMSDTSIELWFGDMRVAAVNDNDVYLVCQNDFKCDIITSRYSALIAKKLSHILGFEAVPHIYSDEKTPFVLDDAIKAEKKYDEVTGMPTGERKRAPRASEKLFLDIDPVVKADEDISIPLNSNQYTFENFIVGASNRFARAASIAVAENPASEYNPLFIHGASGLGKTHLLWAIINYVSTHNPSAKIIYVKGDDFTVQLIECIRRGTTRQFRERYRLANILLIDDIQFIAGKEATQEEFFHTFNALYEDHRQIIMTSDRPPKDIKTLEDRLRTRFEWGLIADIQPPDYELRMAIMHNKAEAMGIKMPDEVIEFLANNLKSNVRQLEGAIKKLGAQSFLTGMPIDIDLAYTCVADLLTGSEPVAVTVDRILDRVSKKTGVSLEDIKSRKRQKNIAYARHTAIYLIRRLTDMSLPAIGKAIGRDHTTIMSSLDAIENEMKNNPSFENDINELIKEIKED